MLGALPSIDANVSNSLLPFVDSEIRPGLILWLILDVALAGKQYSDLGRLTDSMVLVLLFHAIYIFDAVYNEAGIMTQMDITTDGFGFMLSVGDLPWVPFTYCLQARYLAYYPLDLGVTFTCAILAVNALGYYIFRVSNAEKNDFRNGKNPKSRPMLPLRLKGSDSDRSNAYKGPFLIVLSQTSRTWRRNAVLTS